MGNGAKSGAKEIETESNDMSHNEFHDIWIFHGCVQVFWSIPDPVVVEMQVDPPDPLEPPVIVGKPGSILEVSGSGVAGSFLKMMKQCLAYGSSA